MALRGLGMTYNKRAHDHYEQGDFSKSWKDLLKVQEFRGKVDDGFVTKLRKASRKNVNHAIQTDIHFFDGFRVSEKKEVG